jgi:hypothetical protein
MDRGGGNLDDNYFALFSQSLREEDERRLDYRG